MKLNRWECEWRLIYSIIVAGKSAKFADAVMARLIDCKAGIGPFAQLARHVDIGVACRNHRTGNYRKTGRAFLELINSEINFETCTPEDLEKIHGIGPKTSRFFIMWIRPEEKFAALDVHILRWLRAQGHDAPRATPTGKKYAELEAIFLKEAAKLNKTPRELDLEIWSNGAKYVEPQGGTA